MLFESSCPIPRCDDVGDRTTFAYDLDNQLMQVEDAAGAVTTYTYNALQQRVGRDVDGDVTQFLWDGVNLRQESQAGVVEADYTVAPQPYGDLVSQHRATESLFYRPSRRMIASHQSA